MRGREEIGRRGIEESGGKGRRWIQKGDRERGGRVRGNRRGRGREERISEEG